MFRVTVFALVVSACAQGSENQLPQYQPDASPQADASITNMDAAGPVCTKAKVVYLNYGSQMITQAAASDAKTNKVAWMTEDGITQATVPGRANDQATITSGITNALTGLSVDVVTTRPASGEYMMIVFGGTNANVGTIYQKAVQTQDCNNVVPSDVAWIAGSATIQEAINYSLGAIGFGVGLNATSSANGCMCGWGNAASCNTAAQCVFSTNIATVAVAGQCANQASQDEQAKIRDGFCQ